MPFEQKMQRPKEWQRRPHWLHSGSILPKEKGSRPRDPEIDMFCLFNFLDELNVVRGIKVKERNGQEISFYRVLGQ